MALAVQMKGGRRALARMIAEANGASTPSTIGKLLTCTIGNGAVAEFSNPLVPPPVDPDDTGLRGAALTNGTKSNPTVQYLVAAPGIGAITYGDQEYDVSGTPTDLLLFTWQFGPTDAVGEWREILLVFSLSNEPGWKIHPVGTVSGWLTKTNQEQRPVRFLLEL